MPTSSSRKSNMYHESIGLDSLLWHNICLIRHLISSSQIRTEVIHKKNIMKKIFFVSILILFGNSFVIAQNFKLKVISDNAPLGYAYVYINGRAYCSADSAGVALIPISLLKLGDTLSASFVGSKDNSLIYSNKVAHKGESSINLEQSLNLNDVVVTSYGDSKKLFKKYVNIYQSADWNYELRGDFILKTTSDRIHQTIQGSFKHQLIPDLYRIETGETGLEIDIKSDTAGYIPNLNFFYFFSYARIAIKFSKRSISANNFIINYKGEVNDERVFFVTFRLEKLKRTTLQSYQTLIYVNKETKDITHALNIVIFQDGSKCETNVNYQVDKKQKVIYPIKIQAYRASLSDKTILELSAENTTLHRIPLRNFNLQAPANKK